MPSSKVYRILSLSGGGVRGLITAVWLNRLEQKLGTPIAEFFDLIAGTSTGSLIACALSMGMKTETIVRIYRDRAQEIFPAPASRLWSRFSRTFSQGLDAPRYDSKGLELVLRSVFGDARFGDLRVPTLVTSYNLASREALVFKTIPNAGLQVLAETYRKYNSFPVWEICKASSSAPVYFPAHITQIDGRSVPLIDGGVVANNPTACAIAEAVRINDARSVDQRIPLGNFVVASFGTGQSSRPIATQESQVWGALEWAIPLIDVLFDGSADAVDYIAQQILPDNNYFRFQTPLDKAYDDIDRTDTTNLNALITVAQDYLSREGDALLDKLIIALKS
jgi:patatin-like phospholipase/acyl hydrolase